MLLYALVLFRITFSLLLATWVYTTFTKFKVSVLFVAPNDGPTLRKLTRFVTVPQQMAPNDGPTRHQTTDRRLQTTDRRGTKRRTDGTKSVGAFCDTKRRTDAIWQRTGVKSRRTIIPPWTHGFHGFTLQVVFINSGKWSVVTSVIPWYHPGDVGRAQDRKNED